MECRFFSVISLIKSSKFVKDFKTHATVSTACFDKAANPLRCDYRAKQGCEHVPCQRTAAHCQCTPPAQRTDSTPSCVSVCGGRPAGLGKSSKACGAYPQGTRPPPGPQRWSSPPSRPSPTGGAAEPGESRRLSTHPSHTTSSGPRFPKAAQVPDQPVKKNNEWGSTNVRIKNGSYPHM